MFGFFLRVEPKAHLWSWAITILITLKIFHNIMGTRLRLGMPIIMLLNYCTRTSQLLTVKPELFEF